MTALDLLVVLDRGRTRVKGRASRVREAYKRIEEYVGDFASTQRQLNGMLVLQSAACSRLPERPPPLPHTLCWMSKCKRGSAHYRQPPKQWSAFTACSTSPLQHRQVPITNSSQDGSKPRKRSPPAIVDIPYYPRPFLPFVCMQLIMPAGVQQ